MKIGFVFDDSLDKPDGVQQYILALGGWFRAQGHEVHFLVGETKRTDLENLHSLSRNMHVRFNGNRMSIPLPADKHAIRQLLQQEQFDVLHVQMPYSPFLAAKIIKAAPSKTAVVGTFHIMPQSGVVRLATYGLGMWLRSTLKRFDSVFAVSDAARDFAGKVFKLKEVSVLPNVVDVRRFADAETFAQYDDRMPTIMFLGRLVPRKGCMTLLEAAKILADREINFRVVVCGKGELLPELRAYVNVNNLDKYVEFTGFVEETDKPRFVKSADVMVFPSTGGESFGIVLIEAMAAAKPVVLAGDNDGYRSVLQRSEQLFRPGDAAELADKLVLFLQDKGTREQAVAWQTGHVQQFDVQAVGAQLLSTYHTICGIKS
jgi:phosphatidylinositol alpha-mannosyltransferase